MKIKIIPVFIFMFVLTAKNAIGQNDFPLGVWSVAKVVSIISGKEYVNSKPLPSKIIFTKNNYSIVWMPGTKLQQNYAKRWNPSNEEKIISYNSIIVNAGTYTIEKNIITTKPEVAKTPDFINGFAKFEYEQKADTLKLTLIDNVSNDGIQDSAAVKYKTTLVLRRVE